MHTFPIPPKSYRGCLKMAKLLPKSYPNWPWPPLKPKNFDFFVDNHLVTIKIFDMACGNAYQPNTPKELQGVSHNDKIYTKILPKLALATPKT